MSARKFILNSEELGRVILVDDPQGWDTVKKVFTRNLEYTGVFRKQTLNLKFVGDGLMYCVDLFNKSGTEAVLNITIAVKKDYEDAWELDFQGVGKLNPFDLEWDDDLSPSLTIEFEDSGFHAKLLARDDMEVNIGQEQSIEGVELGAVPTKDIQITQRAIEENNKFTLSENSLYARSGFVGPDYFFADGGHIMPFEKTEGDTDFIQSGLDYLVPVTLSGLICSPVVAPTALNIKGSCSVNGNTWNVFLTAAPAYLRWHVRKFLDNTLAVYEDTLLHEVLNNAGFNGGPFSTSFQFNVDIQLDVNQSFAIICEVDTSLTDQPGYDVMYTALDLNIKLIQNFNEHVSKGHYRFEFLKRIIQIITDQSDCLESTVFGRTDLGYAVNGEYSNNVAMNGLQIRGYTDRFPVWSFKKAIKAMQSIFNVHAGVQRFGSTFKVVVEKLPYFFDGHVSITLHNVTSVKRRVAEEFTFSKVDVGYEKAEYEEVNGLEEYNNKCEFATFIKSDKKTLNLISPERADPHGGEFCRRKHISIAATEDTRYDNDVFTYMVKEVNGVLKPVTNEDFISVENITSPETAMNLDITPQRNLLRNGDWVSGCVYKYGEENLKFNSSDRSTNLVTQKAGEPEVAEQTSILNKNLPSSLWLNHYYEFEASVTPAQIAAIEKHPYYLIKFSPFSREKTKKYYYGWVFNIQVGGEERKGSFVLLAANINSDRLVLVDPEGIHEQDDSSELPPQDDGFGFEYSFEHVFEA